MRRNSQLGRPSGRLALIFATTVVAGGMYSHAYGQATPVTWVGTTGDYNAGANWSSGVTPANVNNEYLEINNGGTAQISADAEGAFLNLGLNPGDVGSLQITAGTVNLGELRVGGRETLQDGTPDGGGTGSVVQGGDSVVNVTFSTGTEPPVQSAYIGDAGLTSGNTANGSYTIKDNAVLLNGILSNDQLVIGTGPGTIGTFLQQDNSSVTSTGTVIVSRSGATGSYTISGGTLTAAANSLQIADAGDPTNAFVVPGTVGSFIQTGGTVNIKGMDDGRRGGTGTYTMTGGTLNLTGQFNVGTTASTTLYGSNGTFNVSGDSVITTASGGNIFVGFNGNTTAATGITSTGVFNMTGGTLTMSNTQFEVGSGIGATGTVNLSGGTIQGATGVSVLWNIGRSSGSGTVNLSGTGILNANSLAIGASGTTGTLNISGGTLITSSLTTGTGTGTVNYSGGSVSIGSMTLQSKFITSTDLTLNSSITYGSNTIEVDAGTFTLTGPITTGSIKTLTKTGVGTLSITGALTPFLGTVMTNSIGTLNLSDAGSPNLVLNANSATATNLNQSLDLYTLAVANTRTATLTAAGNHVLTINALNSSPVGLNLNATGTLDLKNNSLIYTGTAAHSVASVVTAIATAYAGGAWTGTGLTSTTARDRSDHATGLGYLINGSSITVKYTWAGDLNLDGKMDGDDYALIDRQVAIFGLGAAGNWSQGDVDYNGTVGTDDYMIMDTAFAHASGGTLSPEFLAEREAEFGSAYVSQLIAAVPEPTSLGLVAIAAATLASRRRCHSR